MGIIHPGIPKDFVHLMKGEFDVHTLIETGTYLGDTAYWGSQIFKQVYTIESSPDLFLKSKTKYAHISNIHFINGDSRQILKRLAHEITYPALFWLDAHWSGGKTAGSQSECPVLEELDALSNNPGDRYILIDDARMFFAPPPPPHDPDKWPNINLVLQKLSSLSPDYYQIIWDDVIISVPLKAKTWLINYCQQYASPPLQVYSRQPDQIPKLWRRVIRKFQNLSRGKRSEGTRE